jgi:hypothetical protein
MQEQIPRDARNDKLKRGREKSRGDSHGDGIPAGESTSRSRAFQLRGHRGGRFCRG